MSDLIRIHTTAASEQEATAIARKLLELKLVACVQVSGPVTSHYCWNGQQEESREWCCTIKTTAAAFAAADSAIREIHSYDVPQIVATPIINASVDYEKWVAESVNIPI